MKPLILILTLAATLAAQEPATLSEQRKPNPGDVCIVSATQTLDCHPPKPDPEIAALKQQKAALQQKADALEMKSRGCFEIYQADMTLNALSKQEPPK